VSDIFQEIDEDLRRENYAKLWTRYGRYVIALGVLVIVATAALGGWREYRQRERQALGVRYATALDLARQGKDKAAADVFDAIADGASGGHAVHDCCQCTPCCGDPCSFSDCCYCLLCWTLCNSCTSAKLLASSTGREDCLVVNHLFAPALLYCSLVSCLSPLLYFGVSLAWCGVSTFFGGIVRHNIRVARDVGSDLFSFGDFLFPSLCPCLTFPQILRASKRSDWDWWAHFSDHGVKVYENEVRYIKKRPTSGALSMQEHTADDEFDTHTMDVSLCTQPYQVVAVAPTDDENTFFASHEPQEPATPPPHDQPYSAQIEQSDYRIY